MMNPLNPGDCFKCRTGNASIVSLLGKGKSGHSYLAELDDHLVVLKIMHDEPNPYYSFTGNKVEAEVESYNKLAETGIRIPILFESDPHSNSIIKEYIEGIAASEKIAENTVSDSVIKTLFEYACIAASNGFNIDYFPTNFIIDGSDNLYYIDYEVNPYSEEWNLANWGVYYWANSEGFRKFIETGNAGYINRDVSNGIPVKEPFGDIVSEWISKFSG